MPTITIEILGTIFFGIALVHTLSAPLWRKASHAIPAGPWRHGLHLAGDVELIFAFWSIALILTAVDMFGTDALQERLRGASWAEPLFVLLMVVMCSTRPILNTARVILLWFSRLVARVSGASATVADVFAILFMGSLLGSFITEPAAMTVSAMLLLPMIRGASPKLLFALVGTLFVNISVGGALTPYAAPPILMVAHAWGWDFAFVAQHLAWRAALTVFITSLIFVWLFRREIADQFQSSSGQSAHAPVLLTICSFVFLVVAIVAGHNAMVLAGMIVAFAVFGYFTKQWQDSFRWREGIFVGLFLMGVVIFGPFQGWWLQPLLENLGTNALYVSAIALTAFVDNAALTYLGTQVPHLSEAARLALVDGALVGGGLTLIANAPNPVGANLLQKKFPGGQISAFGLLRGAILPTIVAGLCFWGFS